MIDEQVDQPIGERRWVSLAHLYLDPNNFRFVDRSAYSHVAPDDVFKSEVQRRTTALILGRSQRNVQDLISSIKENGWLEIDPVLVRNMGRSKYLVIEGNRRVATLKHLQRLYDESSLDLGKLDRNFFSRVPVVLYVDTDPRHHLVLMGLHHITGKRRWPAVNRALAIAQLYEHFNQDADQVCRSLGISKREFNLSIRTLALVNAYKDSDYGDQFESDQYNLFREILNNPALRDWIGWDNKTHTSTKTDQRDRLFSWMSSEETEDDEESDALARDPIITTVGHVRELAKIIGDPIALAQLDETRSLQEAALSSSLLVKSEIDKAFGTFDLGIRKIDMRIGDLKPENIERIDQIIGRLQGFTLAHKRQSRGASERFPWRPFNEITRSQFSSICIEKYRGIDGLILENPRRINVIVGINNSGKTSLLEAIYLLTRQNDERALLDIIHWRARSENEPTPMQIVERIQKDVRVGEVRIAGVFDDVDKNQARVSFKLIEDPDDDVIDQTSFLSNLVINSEYDERFQSTDAVFFGDRPRRTNFRGDRHWLCRSEFTSPFWANRPEMLARCNRESADAGTKDDVMEFMRNNIDQRIKYIELIDEKTYDFSVVYDGSNTPRSLSSFGDGMRRTFEIGLLFANVRGGVLLIDEVENAIHVNLLTKFMRMVRKLAEKCNVQVFMTTHSKEAIDAIVLDEHQSSAMAGYALLRREGGIKAKRYDGGKLRRLHEVIGFDMRGLK